MVKISSRQALIYSSVVFLFSFFLSYFFSGENFSGAGFIFSIFLTIFIDNKYSTIVAAGSAAIAIVFISALHSASFFSMESFSVNVFFILIIVLTAIISLYLKHLLRHMQFDKTHMTSLFENATEGIILTGSTGKIILVNPAAGRVFGYEEEELIGKKIEALIPERFLKNHDQYRTGFYQQPQNRQMGIGLVLFAKKKDGSEFPVEISLSYYREDDEAFVIAFVVDITARKRNEMNAIRHQLELEKLSADMRLLNSELELKVEERTHVLQEALSKLEKSQRELSEALDKEKQLNEIKSRFVSMASHEFRTPLSTVLSSASLLSKYIEGSEQVKRQKHIVRIKDSVNHLNEILEDFLSLGKLDEGKVAMSIGKFNPEEYLSDIIDEMKVHLKKGQEIIFGYSGKDEFFSDHKLLRNISINLISNAIKFSEEDKRIFVTCNVNEQSALLSVKDEGIGISEEDQRHLFSSFFRGQNAANIQGTGLGLHIVKRYVDLLKGSITLQTNLEKGSTFTIDIPSQYKN